jgi:hypothetical protein
LHFESVKQKAGIRKKRMPALFAAAGPVQDTGSSLPLNTTGPVGAL